MTGQGVAAVVAETDARSYRARWCARAGSDATRPAGHGFGQEGMAFNNALDAGFVRRNPAAELGEEPPTARPQRRQ
jgi:hypothetical protein